MWDHLVEIARRGGPIPKHHFRVMTIEADDRLGSKDFDSLATARRYADDAASENDNGKPIALVLDHNFVVIDQGRPYYFGRNQ